MEIINSFSFVINSNFAFFKKPNYNKKFFTYGQIHKPNLLGLFGSILGFNGYSNGINKLLNKLKKEKKLDNNKEPEFYYKLKDIEISIIPLNFNKNLLKNLKDIFKRQEGLEYILNNNRYSTFKKFFNNYNNSLGLFSHITNDGSYTVAEQTLLEPSWLIFVKEPSKDNKELYEYYKLLKNKIKNEQSEFLPYLGQNTYPASINFIDEYKLYRLEDNNKKIIHSIISENNLELENEENFNDVVYKEELPVGINFNNGNPSNYKTKFFYKINEKINTKNDNLYRINNKNINLCFI